MRAKRRAKNTRGWLVLNALLTVAVLSTAVAVVETTHQCRLQYARLQDLQSREWNLQENWSRLLLEESTWAAPHRVEKVAREELSMHPPGRNSEVQDMKLVRR